jgi:hypothetical protein
VEIIYSTARGSKSTTSAVISIKLDTYISNATKPNFTNVSLDGAHKRSGRDTRSFNSRRSSTDSSEDGGPGGVRELRQEMRDLEEKFKKAMVANASLDNEKCQLIFQVLSS